MKKINYINIPLILLLLISCEKEVDFQKEMKPKIIISSLIDCNSVINVIKVSESVSLFSDKKPIKIKKPNLQVKVNGKILEKPVFSKDKDKKMYYNFTSSLKPGDKVELSSDTDKYGIVKGIAVVPKLAKIKNIDTEWFKNSIGDDFLKIYTEIEDITNEKNYYRIVVKTKHTWDYTSDVRWQEREVLIDQEPIFRDITNSNYKSSEFKIFSDVMFPSKSYTLNVYIKDEKFNTSEDIDSNHKHFIKIEIHSISEAMFKYLKSVELLSKQDFFQEPVKLYTNMNGGYGVIGIYNKTFSIKEIEK